MVSRPEQTARLRANAVVLQQRLHRWYPVGRSEDLPTLHEIDCQFKGLLGEWAGCTQDSFRDLYRQGELDSRKVVVDIPSTRISMNTMEGPGGQALQV